MTSVRRLFVLIFLISTTLPAQQKELSILFSTPRGATTSIDQSFRILVTFSEPMTALAAAGHSKGLFPLEITPRVKGTYRWLGTTTLAFIPKDTLPNATRYTVTIPAGTRSLTGAKLRKPFSWTFETPRPTVLRTMPAAKEQRVPTDQPIVVIFNQPVDTSAIGRWIEIVEITAAGDSSRCSFTLRRPTNEELLADLYRRNYRAFPTVNSVQDEQYIARMRNCALAVVPSSPFRKASAIRFICKAGLQAQEGPLGMVQEFSTGFSIYGELNFQGVHSDNNNFMPEYPVRFDFSNPVSLQEVLRHLTITPEARIIPPPDYDRVYDKQYVEFELKPDSEYKGTITSGMKDVFGNTLASDAPFSFRTSSVSMATPSTMLRTGMCVVEAYEDRRIPVVFDFNCDSVDFFMGRLEPEEIIPFLAGWIFYDPRPWTETALNRVGAKERITRMWTMEDHHIKSHTRVVDPDEVLGKKETGTAVVQMREYGPRYPAVWKSCVQVTNIGLTAKFSADSVLIWATRMKDVSPLEGAEVELRTDSNRVVWRGRTDAEGLACAPGWKKLGVESAVRYYNSDSAYGEKIPPNLWVFVKKKDDYAFTYSQWGEKFSRNTDNRFNSDSDLRPATYDGVIFTDRGLYKAGETVNVKAIVRMRREGAWQSVPGARVRVHVGDSRGEKVMEQEATLDQFGSLSFAIPLKPSAPTGHYYMSIAVYSASDRGGKGIWISAADDGFRVEVFRAAEFEVRSKFDRESYTIGDTVRGSLSARYLFGAPMTNAAMRWHMYLSPASYTPKGYETYSFGPLRWLSDRGAQFSSKRLGYGESTLDEQGSMNLAVPLAIGEQSGTLSLTLEGSASSASRQNLSNRASVIVHGGEYYVGVKPHATFTFADCALDVSLVTVTKEGVPVQDRAVVMKIYRRTWRPMRSLSLRGRSAGASESVDTLCDSILVKTAIDPVVHRFTPAEAGFYYIDASATDDRGNRITTQSMFYVSGRGRVVWNQGEDSRTIELVSDRASYVPGDKAEILVKNPFERATAFVSIEREGILSHYKTELKGSAPRILVPIEHSYLPNVFVSVVLVDGCHEAKSDSGTLVRTRPSCRIGYLKLSVSPEEKHLRVSVVTSQKDYLPGDTVTALVTVRSQSGAGVKSNLTVSAADMGVLNLIDYQLPDPFVKFYRQRGLEVSMTDSRISLSGLLSYASASMASQVAVIENDLKIDDASMRNLFQASAYWNPSLVTDDSGRAEIRFKLPDNITSFRLMTTAQTLTSEFGKGETSFTVSKPILLQPSLPALARAGDAFDAGVVVVNMTKEKRTVLVKANATGIFLGGDRQRRVELAPSEAREVTYHFIARTIDTAIVTFTASSGSDTDGLERRIPVVAQRAKETTALFGSSIDAVHEERIFIPRSVEPNEGEVEFTAASTGLLGLSGAMTYLFTYPYGCLEQRASAALPIILASDLVGAFKLEVFKDRDYHSVAQKMVDELPLFQNYEGGFSYWKGEGEASPYLSAYAVYTLLEAREHGYTISTKSLEQGLRYLSGVLAAPRRTLSNGPAEPRRARSSGRAEPRRTSSMPSDVHQCTRAFILYTLARAARPDVRAMDQLFAQRDSLPLFAKAYLMRASALNNPNSEMVNELARDFLNHVKVDPTGASFEEPEEGEFAQIFHSNTRTTAVVLLALVEANKDSALTERIVHRLLSVQRNGRWRTTQENLFVISALASYFKKYEAANPNFRARIALDGKTLLSELFEGRSFETKKEHVPLSMLLKGKTLPVTFGKQGEGRLYYGIRLNYLPRGASEPMNEGLTVIRAMEPAEADSGAVLRTGELLKVTVTVIAPQDRHYVAVDDPMPAGLEVVATTFATSVATIRENNGVNSAFDHIERYDDRVSLFADYLPAGVHTYTYYVRAVHAGTYVVPPTHAECMYEPEVFGSTASGAVTIQK